ncbi:MAG: NUDIX domain-containing protein [Bacteroidota bacterium]
MRIRAVAILIEDEKVAVIKRHRAGTHYFTFPGGGVDPGETVEQAVIGEVDEGPGLRVVVRREVAGLWVEGNRQEYFLVERIRGEFGTGLGEEYLNPLPETPHGTCQPVWMPLSEVLSQPVLPRQIAERVVRFAQRGWSPESFVFPEAA